MTDTKFTGVTEDELSKVVGGIDTGAIKDGKVYFAFPSPASFLSGYYDVEGIEKLAKNYYSLKDLIAPYITQTIKDAINNLYALENKTPSSTVKEVLGL